MKRVRKVLVFSVIILVLGLAIIVIPITISSIRPGISIKQEHLDSLLALEKIAVQNGDYPIAAMVIYKDSIIGSGYNTIKNLNVPVGHAEINAIESVFQSMHYSDFRALSRDSLVLITSFEPCIMCKGIINYHNIRRTYFLNPKKIRYRLKYLRQDISFYLRIRKIKVPGD